MTPQLEAIERAIIDVEREGLAHAAAASLESTLENARAGIKEQAVKRFIAGTPALSPTAAEKAAAIDLDYQKHLDEQRKATLAKNEAYTRFCCSRLRCLMLLVDAIHSDGHPLKSLLATEIDLDLLRQRDDEREQLVGGVPR